MIFGGKSIKRHVTPHTTAAAADDRRVFLFLRSWSFDVWKDEMNSFEKGFYGWACSVMSMEDCSPYQVIELDEQQVVGNNGLATATSEEFVVEDEV